MEVGTLNIILHSCLTNEPCNYNSPTGGEAPGLAEPPAQGLGLVPPWVHDSGDM